MIGNFFAVVIMAVRELIVMVIFNLVVSLLTGAVFSLCNGSFNAGTHVGTYIGMGAYIIYCLWRIFRPTIEGEYTVAGYRETDSTVPRGIIGLVVTVLVFIYTAITGRW